MKIVGEYTFILATNKMIRWLASQALNNFLSGFVFALHATFGHPRCWVGSGRGPSMRNSWLSPPGE